MLSPYSSDLNSIVNNWSGSSLSTEIFAHQWASLQTNYGIDQGKFFYEVRVDCLTMTSIWNADHHIRIGWSTLTDDQLGKNRRSFGFCSCAKKVTDSVSSDYGSKYGSPGDVVGVYLDMDSSPCIIWYTLNGVPLGTAFEFTKEDISGSLCPHIMIRNISFTVNFGQHPNSFLGDSEHSEGAEYAEYSRDYNLIGYSTNLIELDSQARQAAPEVIAFSNIIADERRIWAEQHAAQHPEKLYANIGLFDMISRMTVSKSFAKHNHCHQKLRY